jgi:hypothetical protein
MHCGTDRNESDNIQNCCDYQRKSREARFPASPDTGIGDEGNAQRRDITAGACHQLLRYPQSGTVGPSRYTADE